MPHYSHVEKGVIVHQNIAFSASEKLEAVRITALVNAQMVCSEQMDLLEGSSCPSPFLELALSWRRRESYLKIGTVRCHKAAALKPIINSSSLLSVPF